VVFVLAEERQQFLDCVAQHLASLRIGAGALLPYKRRLGIWSSKTGRLQPARRVEF
jgi:hypothetical protein